MPPVIDSELCIGCMDCADACQCDVYFGSTKGEEARVTYPEECWHCNACVFVCSEEAIKLRIPLPLMVLYQDRNTEVTRHRSIQNQKWGHEAWNS